MRRVSEILKETELQEYPIPKSGEEALANHIFTECGDPEETWGAIIALVQRAELTVETQKGS